MLGDFLPVQLIHVYKGKTTCCHPKFEFPNDWDITHAPKHQSNEDTTSQYIKKVNVEQVRGDVGSDKSALVIMYNFKGQTTEAIPNLLEENNLLVNLLPANTSGNLQPMDISVNKPVKDYIQDCFEDWYANKIVQQLEDNEDQKEEVCPKPVDLSLPLLKQLGAKWLIEYVCQNLLFTVNGFARLGITAPFDGEIQPETLSDDSCSENYVDSNDDLDSDDDLGSDDDSVC